VVWIIASEPRFFDTETREFHKFPEGTPKFSCHSYAFRDGCLYYGSENSTVKLDVRTGKHTKVADAPGKVANVALGPDGTIYFSSGADVYKIGE
jgi:glucose/arabinose dehydrogenase